MPVHITMKRPQGSSTTLPRPGVRAVDGRRGPPALPPGARIRRKGIVTKKAPVSASALSSSSSEESSDISPIRSAPPRRSAPRPPVDDNAFDDDDELLSMVESKKLRSGNSRRSNNDSSLDSADSSEHFRSRKREGDAFRPHTRPKPPIVSKLPPRPSMRPAMQRLPPRPSQRPTMSAMPRRASGSTSSESSDESSDESSYESSSSDDSDDLPNRMRYDPLEEETLKAVRKAKLLARIDQLQGRGVAVTKTYTHRTSEEELVAAVAKMEILDARSTRIEQGRAFFMGTLKTVESGANIVDRRKWIPIKLALDGLTQHVRKDIHRFDDCLERGVAETLGPVASRVWWVELLYILVPTMVNYSINNRMTSNPNYANEVMRGNPEFQQQLAREMAKELAHTEMTSRQQLEAEVRELRDQVRVQSSAYTTMPPPSQPTATKASSQQQRTLPSSQQQRTLPSGNPLGDIPPDPAETARMQALLREQQELRAASKKASTVPPLQPPTTTKKAAMKTAMKTTTMKRPLLSDDDSSS